MALKIEYLLWSLMLLVFLQSCQIFNIDVQPDHSYYISYKNTTDDTLLISKSKEGFAVVAAEVRKLAEWSRLAADEITLLTQKSYVATENAGTQLNKVVPEIDTIVQLIKEISNSGAEQNSGIISINRELNQLDQIAQNNASTAKELTDYAENLNLLSSELAGMIRFFKL